MPQSAVSHLKLCCKPVPEALCPSDMLEISLRSMRILRMMT